MVTYLPIDRPSARTKIINRASRTCPTIPSLKPLDRLPPQVVFTFVDLRPRLITVTHHDAIAGPSHRHGDAILDAQHGFGGKMGRAAGRGRVGQYVWISVGGESLKKKKQ